MSSDFDPSTLGCHLRKARLARGLTQAEVAAVVGLNVNTYGRLERGLACPSIGTLRRLCVALRASADALLDFPPGGPPPLPEPEDPPALQRLMRRLRRADPDVVRFVSSLLAEMEESEKR